MRLLLFASRLRATWLRLRNRGATIRLGDPVYFGPATDLRLGRGTTFVAGDRAHLRRNCVVEINGDGRVEIGADTQLTYNVIIQCSTSIVIGARCMIGAGLIVDGNHRFVDSDLPLSRLGYEYRPVAIGDDVYIGVGAIVMADVGDRAVVGANAVVTKPVPPRTVVAGVPARPIKQLEPGD